MTLFHYLNFALVLVFFGAWPLLVVSDPMKTVIQGSWVTKAEEFYTEEILLALKGLEEFLIAKSKFWSGGCRTSRDILGGDTQENVLLVIWALHFTCYRESQDTSSNEEHKIALAAISNTEWLYLLLDKLILPLELIKHYVDIDRFYELANVFCSLQTFRPQDSSPKTPKHLPALVPGMRVTPKRDGGVVFVHPFVKIYDLRIYNNELAFFNGAVAPSHLIPQEELAVAIPSLAAQPFLVFTCPYKVYLFRLNSFSNYIETVPVKGQEHHPQFLIHNPSHPELVSDKLIFIKHC
jgi:hypothetical protein